MTYPAPAVNKMIRQAVLDVVDECQDHSGFVFGFWIPDLVGNKIGKYARDVSAAIVNGWVWDLINDGYLDIDGSGKVTRGAKAADEAGQGDLGLRGSDLEASRVEGERDPGRTAHGVCCLLPGTGSPAGPSRS